MTEAQVGNWSAPGGVLGELVALSYARADALRSRAAELERAAAEADTPPAFAAALRGGTVSLICEVKRRSPSRGIIAAELDAATQAASYEAGGASAVSVLTEPERFGGAIRDLADVRGAVAIPLLRKDFLVHELQFLEARAAGASAVLIIAAALPPESVRALVPAAHALGMDALVEVRTESELHTALESGARVIGVNVRNLVTLEMDPAVAERLIPAIPSDRVAIYESGIVDRAGVMRAAGCGADAVLVGSSLSARSDAARAVRELSGVVAQPRNG